MKKLTYTKADILAKAKAIPYGTLPTELLTADQRSRRDRAIDEVNEMCEVYKKETGRNSL